MAAITTAVDIKIDRTRKFRLTINDLVEIEEIFGGLSVLAMKMTFKSLRTVLRIGLRADDKELDDEATGDLMSQYLRNGGTVRELGDLVMTALERAGVIARVEKKTKKKVDGEDDEPGEATPR